MIHRFQLGRMRCTICSDGQMKPPWEPPWETFFGPETGVSDAYLRAALADEGSARQGLALGYNCLCVETDEARVLVDTGLGRHFHGYGPELSAHVGHLERALAQANLRAADISTIIFTHLHQDHIRGAIWSGGLTFPHASHLVHTAELAFWRSGIERPENADHAAVVISALALLGQHLQSVPFNHEIVPGLRTIAASGHTPGHMGLLMESGGQRLLCVGDLFYDTLQVRHPDWWARYDLDPSESVRTRRELLAWAADEQLLVHAYHMPFPGLGRIHRHGTAFVWQDVASAPQ